MAKGFAGAPAVGSGIGSALGALAGTFLFPGVGTALGAAVGGGLGGAAGGALNMFGGGDDEAQFTPTILNPATSPLASLLGQTFIIDDDFTGFVGGPGGVFSGMEDITRDYLMNPIGLFGSENALVRSLLEDPTGLQNLLGRTQGALGTGLDTALRAVQTGLPTDPSAAFRAAQEDFIANILPQIAETTGIRGSPFIATAGRAGEELARQQALAQIGLQEAASARRLESLGPLISMAGANMNLPLSLAGDVLGLGQGVRSILEEQRARPLQTLLQISQGVAPAGIMQQGFPTTSGTAMGLGALAQSLPGAFSAFMPQSFGSSGSSSGGTVNTSGLEAALGSDPYGLSSLLFGGGIGGFGTMLGLGVP